jgi:hypothetical protein
MAKKSKKIVKNKNKNKNINKIVVNVNSNNKKKVIKSKEKSVPQPSSGPIVISNPSPYVQQPMYYPQPQQLVDNSYGLGSHRLLEGLQTRLDDIKDELLHKMKQNQMAEEKKQETLQQYKILSMKQKPPAYSPPKETVMPIVQNQESNLLNQSFTPTSLHHLHHRLHLVHLHKLNT